MIQSMTGFFCEDAEWQSSLGKKISFFVEVKSLNGRFFEFNTRLPGIFSGLENQISSIFKQTLLRGKVFFSIRMSSEESVFESVKLNEFLLKDYCSILQKIKQTTNLEIDLKNIDWLSLPRLITFENTDLSDEDKQLFLEKFCKRWATSILNDRLREGSSIKQDIKKSVLRVYNFHQKIESTNQTVLQNIKIDLEAAKNRVEETKEDEHLHRLEQKKYAELEFALDKANVNEEISRSKLHLSSIENFLESEDVEVGRKLEFTLQELLRETNTISSKISDYVVNSSCVEIKFELEKIREQSQNIV